MGICNDTLMYRATYVSTSGYGYGEVWVSIMQIPVTQIQVGKYR